MRKFTISIMLVSMCLLCQETLPTATASPPIYKTGTKFTFTVRWLGLSAAGAMEVLENTELEKKDVILVRSRVTKVGGFLGFIVRFLRIYKGSNTFDSYIDVDTLMAVRYEMYKLNKDGSRKINEQIYFDREQNEVVSRLNNRVVASNVAPDIQDTFSAFLTFLYRINTERLFRGKKFALNIYGYEQAFKIEIETTQHIVRDGVAVYTLEIKELPVVFKHPASLAAEVTDVVESFMFPVKGQCELRVPLWPDITIKFELKEIRQGDKLLH